MREEREREGERARRTKKEGGWKGGEGARGGPVGWRIARAERGLAPDLVRHLSTVARCVGVRPPKMKVVAVLIPRALACLDF